MDDRKIKKRSPRFMSWVVQLLAVLLIATGGTIVGTRALSSNHLSCLQIDRHVIDVNGQKDFMLSQAPSPTIYDQLHPSPDGTHIAHVKFVSMVGAYFLSVSDANGHNERLATDNKQLNAFLGWSADSRYFATNSPENGIQRADIWSVQELQVVMHLDAGGVYWSPRGHQFSYAIEGELRLVNPENKAVTTYQLPLPASFSYA
jgi:hypothetical protein